MATRKRQKEHDADLDVYVLQDEDDHEAVDDSTTIETQAAMDWIEYANAEDEEEPAKQGDCRLTFHVDLPEHIAQHLFAHHVRDGKLTIEFHPPSPTQRPRDPLVHS